MIAWDEEGGRGRRRLEEEEEKRRRENLVEECSPNGMKDDGDAWLCIPRIFAFTAGGKKGKGGVFFFSRAHSVRQSIPTNIVEVLTR